MRIVIEIPDDKLTQTQSVMDISLDIISGKVFSAGGYGFCILPKNHGRLIDGDYLYERLKSGGVENCKPNGYLILQAVKNEPTILEGTNNE